MQRQPWHVCLLLLLSIVTFACSREPKHVAQGYMEGRYTYMATTVSGVLTKLMVARGTRVQAGQLLFTLASQPESDAFLAAEENLKQTIAARDAILPNLDFSKLTYERYKVLVPKNAIQQSQLDNAKAAYQSTFAQLAQANAAIASIRAELAQAAWTKDQKAITAPVDAIVFDTYYRLGELTLANQPVLSLLAPSDIKAIFYIPEPALGRIKLNQLVWVRCDGCPKKIRGRISFISPTAEYTPPVIFSNETNHKFIFRVEAEFAPQDAYRLHPGQPVRVQYE